MLILKREIFDKKIELNEYFIKYYKKKKMISNYKSRKNCGKY
jgi:hypothetical protein